MSIIGLRRFVVGRCRGISWPGFHGEYITLSHGMEVNSLDNYDARQVIGSQC